MLAGGGMSMVTNDAACRYAVKYFLMSRKNKKNNETKPASADAVSLSDGHVLKDNYKTVSSVTGEGFFSDRRSRFLAFAHHVTTVGEAMEIIAGYRKKYFDARHCCYAYAIGPEREQTRINDDGEPSSTAGKPIYGQILSHELSDILIVVVRYYGGINLGTPGLINAYRMAASDAIEHCQIVEQFVTDEIVYCFSYPMMSQTMKIISDNGGEIKERNFTDNCKVTVVVRAGNTEKLKRELNKLADIYNKGGSLYGVK